MDASLIAWDLGPNVSIHMSSVFISGDVMLVYVSFLKLNQ